MGRGGSAATCLAAIFALGFASGGFGLSAAGRFASGGLVRTASDLCDHHANAPTETTHQRERND